MSNYNFTTGQAVRVIASHNHINASVDTVYHVGSINRVGGVISVLLLLNGKCIGAVPEGKLIANS